ncbi:MAG: queuine tRNA-ribosyltransferase, partial [Candidatus Berkelbacteria bacterium Licking1014_85]
MSNFKFIIEKKSKTNQARLGFLKTPNGIIQTPSYVTVGTFATVRTLEPDELNEIGVQVILANTYHLHLRPGEKIIKKDGGLAKFMHWNGPTMTDSGGFQAMSLGAGREQGMGKIGFFPENRETDLTEKSLVRITEKGVEFRSHIDGSKHLFTPEISMKIQSDLGADMIFAFDECTTALHNYEYTRVSMERTHRWAIRSLESYNNSQFIFGIIQGGEFKNLREISAKFICDQNFDGIAIGGALGKTKTDKFKILNWITPLLPDDKPRHLLGIGDIDDLFDGVSQGMDLFDCVWPTRLGRRNAFFLTPQNGGNRKNRWR